MVICPQTMFQVACFNVSMFSKRYFSQNATLFWPFSQKESDLVFFSQKCMFEKLFENIFKILVSLFFHFIIIFMLLHVK